MFMYLLSKKARDSRESAKVLYEQIVTQARNPVFYAAYNIPDTPEGRFEMITMHCGLLVNRLCQSSDTKSAKLLAQALFDVMNSGAVRISIGQTYALKDAASAHRDLESRKTTGSSILIP